MKSSLASRPMLPRRAGSPEWFHRCAGSSPQAGASGTTAAATTTHDIQFHRLVAGAQHTHEARLRYLHNLPGLFVHSHRLRACLTHSAEDEPFAIGGPLPMRLIDFGLAI